MTEFDSARGAAARAKLDQVGAPPDLSDGRLLTEHEVARRQGRSVKTLQNERVSGGGIPFLKLGRSVRYRIADVIAWEAARTRRSTSGGGSDV